MNKKSRIFVKLFCAILMICLISLNLSTVHAVTLGEMEQEADAFIEAGKVAKEEIAARKEAERKAEDLRRAQEVMERLNREAAEDQAKKQVEIEVAKQEAKKRFG